MLEQSNQSKLKTLLFVSAQGILELLFRRFKSPKLDNVAYICISWGDGNPQIPEPQDENLKQHGIDSLDRATLARTKN
jgi:hypothetical protein